MILISFSSFENCLSIFESVNDQVTDSRYPFDARDRWDKWNNFCLKFKVSFSLFLSGEINFIFLKPFILISSSIKSTLWTISGLHDGISTKRFFLFFLQLKPNWVRILCASLIDIGIPTDYEKAKVLLKNYAK